MAKRNIFKNRGKTYIFSNKGGGGESGITVTPLTVTENGTYTSAAGQAYSPVTVNVPSSVGGNLYAWTNDTSGETGYTASPNPTVNDPAWVIREYAFVLTESSVSSVIDENNIYIDLYSNQLTRDPSNDIDLGELEVETNRTYSITQNGTIVINPSSGNDVMEKVTATVNVASAEIEANKAVTIDASSYSAPVEVTPTSPNDAMAKTTVTLTNIPSGSGGILYAWYSDGLSEARYTTFNTAPVSLSSDNKIYKFDVETSGDPFVNGLEEETVSDYVKTSDNEFTCTLDGTSRTFHKSTSSYEGEDIIISNEIDIEANKAATIDVSQYSTPVEVTPSSGKDGMAKATITLSNIPVAQGTKLYAYTENIYDPDNPEYYGRSLFATDDIDTSVTGSGTASLVISDTSIDGVVTPEANVPYTIYANGTIRFEGETVDIYVYRTPELDVIVDSGGLEIENNKSISVTQNGTVEITPTSGKDAMGKVTATVAVPSADIETEKTVSITQNGTYIINPTTGKDAMAKVTATVNVATATVEGTNLILSSGSVSGNTLNL